MLARSVPGPIPFDAVVFDLDGTLVATDRFWPDAARAGALRAFEELGISRALPSQAEWMDLVGKPIEAGFDALFPDLPAERRAHVRRRCVEAEHALLLEGRAGLLPGVSETLEGLRAAGVRTGIASNCGRDYLAAMLGDLGLGRWIDAARCLDSPGVEDKADMIEDLLLVFGSRRAVMVGDRIGDRDAAWANGLPHVHLARGYAAAGERVEAEATIEGMDELLPLLAARRRWLEALAADLDPAPGRPAGITGGPASGKTLLAEDLAALTGAAVAGAAPGRGGPALDPNGRWIVEGDRLWEPEVRGRLGTVAFLSVSEAVVARRIQGREGRAGGPGALAEARERLAEHAAAVAAHPPEAAAVRVVEASNPLSPGPSGP